MFALTALAAIVTRVVLVQANFSMWGNSMTNSPELRGVQRDRTLGVGHVRQNISSAVKQLDIQQSLACVKELMLAPQKVKQ